MAGSMSGPHSQNSPAFRQCEAYLRQGTALDAQTFHAWVQEHAGGSWHKEKNLNGDTALHIALECSAARAVVDTLIADWPGSAKEKNEQGITPLHFALQTQSMPEAIKLALVGACPGGVKEKNYQGDTPLHVALQTRGTPEAVVSALMAAWPEGVKETNKNGNTPLHAAAQAKGVSEAVVSALTAAWPAALDTTNWYGLTPLRLALKNKRISGSVVQVICAASPTSDQTLLSIALESKHEDGVIRALLTHVQMQQFGNDTVRFDFDAAAAAKYKASLPLDILRGRALPPTISQLSTPDATASRASARFQQMIAAQPPELHADTAPLSERLTVVRESLNICLQTELSISPTNIATAEDFNCKLYMEMHVDPAVHLIKQELETLEAQVRADPDKYR